VQQVLIYAWSIQAVSYPPAPVRFITVAVVVKGRYVLSYKRKSMGYCAGFVSLFVLLASLPTLAQFAPVAGTHYAGRASDTGFADVNSTGGYSTSVPLDLPAVRGGLPVPLHVVYGGHNVGAAGMSWDVPLTYIFVSENIAHRRPKPATFSPFVQPLHPPQHYVLVFEGQPTELVRNAANTVWVAQRGDMQLEVRTGSTGQMVMYDGQGRTYTFSDHRATASSLTGHVFLLDAITAVSNTVHFEYSITTPTLPGGGSALSINLVNVSYNTHPTTSNCFKNNLVLNYDTAAAGAAPLALSTLNQIELARVNKLTSINVQSKAACDQSYKKLRQYNFSYEADPDTQRPQLHSVTMSGQQDTPENSVTLPVATYTYGTIADPSTRRIVYEQKSDMGPPFIIGAHLFSFGIGFTSAGDSPEGHGPNDVLIDLFTGQNLADLNGDGRPDFVSEAGAFRNKPGANATSVFEQGSFFGIDPTEKIHSAFPGAAGRLPLRAASTVINDTLRQQIDINGDGRMDIIETVLPDIDHWIIHLNKPDPLSGPQNSQFIDITVPVTRMRQALNTTGLSFGRVPLARKTTVRLADYFHCFVWANGSPPQWVETGISSCPADLPPAVDVRKTQTITEFELRDVNGDGYPDFVYNASFVRTSDPVLRPVGSGTSVGQTRGLAVPSDMAGSRDVLVLINTAGTHLLDGVDLFSAPIQLEAGGSSGCGVSRWQPDPSSSTGGILNEVCGFEDINGDGLVDRINSESVSGQIVSRAKMGTGVPDHPYATNLITLPGPLARSETALVLDGSTGRYVPVNCLSGGSAATYDIRRMRGLRDINGDGIADYISGQLQERDPGIWTVAMGTGTGFAAPADVTTPFWGMDPSREQAVCGAPAEAGEVSATLNGLYDIDGDGQPEFLNLNRAAGTGSPHWQLYQLKPPVSLPLNRLSGVTASVPESGRLIKIDNGYHAFTHIGYKSAKEDTGSTHNIPNHEIVVASVATTDERGTPLVSTRRYAYRDAQQIFNPALDRFVFVGYLHTVELHAVDAETPGDGHPDESIATVTDFNGLFPFNQAMSTAERFQRYLLAGRVSDVTILAGALDTDPWSTQFRDLNSLGTLRKSGAHYDWRARLLTTGDTPTPADNELCIDMMFPYDFGLSQASRSVDWEDPCTMRGFLFLSSSKSWRGVVGPLENQFTISTTVKTQTNIRSVDDFGRITEVAQLNDTTRNEDDLCVRTVFATPTGTNERVLSAVATQTIIAGDCTAGTATTLARESFEYDTSATGEKLPANKVSAGFVTAHLVERRDDAGALLSTVREFDATYDALGNPKTVKTTRGDQATRTLSYQYDPFSLVPTSEKTEAVNGDRTALPSLTTAFTNDPLTLDVLTSTDPNGTQYATTFDGFSRPLLSEVKPSGGTLGVLSSTRYLGFAQSDSGGRQIELKVFTDPVAPANVNTAAGRISTVFIDSLGREQRTEAQLGADYSNKLMTVGQRMYDVLGRVKFEADPFPSTETFASAYGTSYYFNVDGTPLCFIRGRGLQAFSRTNEEDKATNETNERYPTCFSRTFASNTETVEVRDARSSLDSTSSRKVLHGSTYTAIGQLTDRYTTLDGFKIESMAYAYDRLGHLNSIKRYGDPVNSNNPVVTSWKYDSTGEALELRDANNAVQLRTFDDWGELTQVQWTDATTSPPTDRRTINRYDALGRTVHTEDRTNNVVDAETVNDYTYDTPVTITTPSLTTTNVKGRLAKAISPTSAVSFSYDSLGRINAEVFTDRTVAPEKVYVEKHTYHGDGSPSALDLQLPDKSFVNEHVAYTYDSAGRTRSLVYSDGTITRDLFKASGASAIDVFGRTRQAQYGPATFTASYADIGRRLIKSLKVTAVSGATREISFAPIAGLPTVFDPLGRELMRTEFVNGSGTFLGSSYDNLGRVVSTNRSPDSTTLPNMTFEYDALGNLRRLNAATGTSGAQMSYLSTDFDRICSIGYGTTAPPTACNVKHDGVGNITEMPTRSNGTRTLSYFANGQVKRVSDGVGNDAQFRYDALGQLQRLDLTSNTSSDTRHDRHFGGLILEREEVISGMRQKVLTRSIPGPGFVATRHGPASSAAWTFSFGDGRGNRFVTDQAGEIVQEVAYQTFGEAKSTGAQPGAPTYTSEQWNFGDALAALGLSQLGARLYDPVIGRFMSRDPLIVPRTAATTNPYAFANNDPVNSSDPSGLDPEGGPTDSPPQCDPGVCSSGPGNDLGPAAREVGHFVWCISTLWLACGSDDPPPPEPATSTISSGGSTKVGSGAHGFPISPPDPFDPGFDVESEIAAQLSAIEPNVEPDLLIDPDDITLESEQCGPLRCDTLAVLNDAVLATAAAAGGMIPRPKLRPAPVPRGPAISRTPRVLNSTELRGVTGGAGRQRPPYSVRETLNRINTGGTNPHPNDGSVFRNNEGHLPQKPAGYYREYVHPTPGENGPGAQRVIKGANGEYYYTPNHYRKFIPLDRTFDPLKKK
jgi:RHS repeat-associated protein